MEAERRLADRADAASLRTSDISLLSHTHGRERREERGIDKRELKEAVKYGRREKANPGRRGETRWKYTHKGIVYVTDESSRHEITSWRLDQVGPDIPLPQHEGMYGTHVVVVVDSSGSMRKNVVPGFPTRTAAVYESLNRGYVRPQLDAARAGGLQLGRIVVTLIEMSDNATVLHERVPIDETLFDALDERKTSRARSHGNYLPALDKVFEVLKKDATTQTQLFLLFLSDGAPSDHIQLECQHGVQVWSEDRYSGREYRGRPALQNCQDSVNCRRMVVEYVNEQCVLKVQRLGDMFGRDRVFVATVAFGPASEDYEVLKSMATGLPRSSFQKLGLTSGGLKTAFSSLSITLTSMRTESVDDGSKRVLTKHDHSTPLHSLEWHVYVGANFVKKEKFNLITNQWDPVPLGPGSIGVAIANDYFESGAERVAYHCMEVAKESTAGICEAVGPALVAKESWHADKLDKSFHKTFSRTQAGAEKFAKVFNSMLRGPDEWQIHFVPCVVYKVKDDNYAAGNSYALVEQHLEGRFTKWNNNAGKVRQPTGRGGAAAAAASLGEILEGDSESDEDDDDVDEANLVDEVPQCFSHFTYYQSDGKQLVCDLQGVWNIVDGFTLTDPVVHYNSGRSRSRVNGSTDKGREGMQKFFETHECSALCRKLGLVAHRPRCCY